MDQPVTPNPYRAPQGRLLSTFVIFLVVVGVLYTLFLVFQQFSVKRQLNTISEQVTGVEAQMNALRNDQIEQLYEAQERADIVENYTVEWSKVVRNLQNLTPVTVFLSSYTGGEDGSVQLSGLADSYGAVADLITAIERSSDFDAAFVPSTTLGTTSDGQDVVSFSLHLNTRSE